MDQYVKFQVIAWIISRLDEVKRRNHWALGVYCWVLDSRACRDDPYQIWSRSDLRYGKRAEEPKSGAIQVFLSRMYFVPGRVGPCQIWSRSELGSEKKWPCGKGAIRSQPGSERKFLDFLHLELVWGCPCRVWSRSELEIAGGCDVIFIPILPQIICSFTTRVHSTAMRRLFCSVLRVSCTFIQSSADTELTLHTNW